MSKVKKKAINSGVAVPEFGLATVAKTPQLVQSVVDELVWKHGANVSSWSDWPDLLGDYGLSPQDATTDVLKLAARHAAERLENEVKGRVPPAPPVPLNHTPRVIRHEFEWWGPHERDEDLFKSTSWLANGYRVSKFVLKHEKETYFGVEYRNDDDPEDCYPHGVGSDPDNFGSPRRFKTLSAALLAAEKHYCLGHDLTDVVSNRDKVAPQAVKVPPVEEPDEEPTQEEDDPKPRTASAPVVKEVASNGGKKPRTPRGTGVIAHIIEALKGASEEKPITKDGVLDILVAAFPDRKRDSMANTVGAQVPSQLRHKGYNVRDNGKRGYWLPG